MVKLFGEELTKRQLLERVGSISQIAGIKRYRLEEGRKDSLLAVDMVNGSGLNITVLPGRGMDIANASYKGIPLVWISKCGLNSRAYHERSGLGWLRNFNGGLLTTCGLTYAGAPCADNGENLGLHGRISNIEADEVCAYGQWIEDDYYLKTSGKVCQSQVFGENICLTREISMKLGENKIFINDTIENMGFESQPFMVIYHMNFGFPIVDKDSKFYVTSNSTEGATDYANRHKDKYNIMSSPENGIEECVFYHKCYGDNDNFGHSAIINEKLKLGVSLSFNLNELENLTEWKMMGQGDYVVGMEPSNCKTLGRHKERENGTLKYIMAGETKHMSIIVEVLDGEDAVENNKSAYRYLKE